ncbi:MAG: SUMF1/EgtB/PvdO family nonheme iron enzyme [Bacteroidales bacterium]|nr:SUMF1/EgtB/PvdO family nonheme iron enzyme [Bacteroidales bacterium]
MVKNLLLLLLINLGTLSVCSQSRELFIPLADRNELSIKSLSIDSHIIDIQKYKLQFFTALIDDKDYSSAMAGWQMIYDTIHFNLNDSIIGWMVLDQRFRPGLKYILHFLNVGHSDHSIENLIPLGKGDDRVYITAEGSKEWPGYLCRSVLYRPGFGPVGVVLPDNAWHLGFTDITLDDTISLTALARRGQRDKERTAIDRWKVTLKPGGWAEYSLWFDIHSGDWHQGMKMMFQERWLYDLKSFDNRLFQRDDLGWMKNTYFMLLQFAWDKKFYDYEQQRFTFYENFTEFDSLTGGYDIFTLWPTWPRLGLDPRNQWDMYRDLPGGLPELKCQADFVHRLGKKYFISYNPWDEGTRKEEQLFGMEELLRATDADGVVLDTKGESSRDLQETADSVKPGIIMYSEGMAVPKDMPGIVSGRVHDALVMPPPLNLNKLIKPDFAIFRVLQLADDRLHREIAVSFFNGYGVEVNTMRPGRPDWIGEDYACLGRTLRILRENNSVFHNYNWVPLIPTLTDSIYVNSWRSDQKVIFTIYSLKPEGFNGLLFECPSFEMESALKEKSSELHFVDLWNHLEVDTVHLKGKVYLPAEIESFNRGWLHTRREGNVGCLAVFNKQLRAEHRGHLLKISANTGSRIVLTAGNPDYHSKIFEFSPAGSTVDIRSLGLKTAKKLVLQLFSDRELLDEQVLFLRQGIPELINTVRKTAGSATIPAGMVEIPAGTFNFYTQRDSSTLEPFIAFPDFSDTLQVKMNKFYMDRFPVTNSQYYNFVIESNYLPKDTSNYLKHWLNGKPVSGTENLPVVYVDPEDAKAYANWNSKRLPSEVEWQYAAQGSAMKKYPWGDKMVENRCNNNLNLLTPVNQFPEGASSFGVQDMIGNVWQMTNDIYDNGAYYFTIIRGGSYFHPTQSIWYVTGGPLPAYHPEMLLLIAPGLNRNATVGFRCVKDCE